MRYLQTYEQHNEGFRTALAGLGLAGSLMTTSPELKSQEKEPIVNIHKSEVDGVLVAKDKLQKLSEIRKSEPVKDQKLNSILQDIESKVQSGNEEEFKLMFDKLSLHLEEKYGYKIETKKVEEEISEAGAGEAVKGMSLFQIMGWLGSICLAVCGIPQAIQSYKDKHSEGISWGFLLLWSFGEIFALIYVYDKLDLPLLLNYATNIFILAIILYYKMYPKNLENTND